MFTLDDLLNWLDSLQNREAIEELDKDELVENARLAYNILNDHLTLVEELTKLLQKLEA
jgi:hypothetical protein